MAAVVGCEIVQQDDAAVDEFQPLDQQVGVPAVGVILIQSSAKRSVQNTPMPRDAEIEGGLRRFEAGKAEERR